MLVLTNNISEHKPSFTAKVSLEHCIFINPYHTASNMTAWSPSLLSYGLEFILCNEPAVLKEIKDKALGSAMWQADVTYWQRRQGDESRSCATQPAGAIRARNLQSPHDYIQLMWGREYKTILSTSWCIFLSSISIIYTRIIHIWRLYHLIMYCTLYCTWLWWRSSGLDLKNYFMYSTYMCSFNGNVWYYCHFSIIMEQNLLSVFFFFFLR